MPYYPPYQPLPAGWTQTTAMEYDLGMPLLLWRVRQMTITRLLPVLRDRKLTEPQWRMLRMLQFRGNPMSQTDLARAAGFYVTHIRRMAEYLYAYGAVDWFKRDETRATHRQQWKIGITRYGHKLIAQVQNALAERRVNTSALFSDEDERNLSDLLTRYMRAVAWTPWQCEEAMFNPLHAYHDKHRRRSAFEHQVWKHRQKAKREGRELTREEILAEMDDI